MSRIFNPQPFLLKTFLLLLCIFPCYYSLMAQQVAAPEKVGTFLSTDTAFVHSLFRKVDIYGRADIDSAITWIEQAKDYSLAMGYLDGIAHSLMLLGFYFSHMGKNDTAIQYLKAAAPFCYQAVYMKERLLSQWYSNIAVPYAQKGQYDTALIYLIKGAGYAISVKDTMIAMELYIRTGVTWNLNGQYKNALYYFRKAEQIARTKGAQRALAHIYNNYAMNHFNLGDTLQAFTHMQQALKLSKKTRNKLEEGTALGLHALHYLSVHKPDSAIYFLTHGKQLNNQSTVSPAKRLEQELRFSYAYYQLKNYPQSLHYALNAQRIAEGTGHKRTTFIEVYKHLATLYRDMGDYRNAYEYQLRYTRVNDSLKNAARNRSIDQLEAQYRSVEKDRLLTQGKLKLSERDKKITKQNLWILGIASGAVIIFTVLLLLYTFSRYRQGRQLAALRQLEQEKKIEQLQALMQGEENERKRIARELHDGVASTLSAAKMQLSNIGRKDLPVLTATDMYQNGLGLLQEAYDEIRYTAHNLSAEKLLQNGLVASLNDYCRRISMPGFEMHYRHFGEIPPLGNDMTIGVYRVAQELLHNIQKHAAATTVNVQTGYDGEVFFLSIEDNGVGMEPQQHRHNGIGLQNIASRIAIWGGTTLEVDSRADTGTTVYMSFVLKQ